MLYQMCVNTFAAFGSYEICEMPKYDSNKV